MAISNLEEKRSVRVSGHDVNYYIKYNPGQKNLILKIREGIIHISTPTGTPDESVEALIRKNYSKIAKIQINFELNNKYDFYATKPWIKIFDKKVEVHIVDENINTKIDKDGIWIKNYNDNELQLKKIYSFLSRYYRNWFINRTSEYSTIMGLNVKHISIKTMTARWGACYIREEKIIYNTKLLHFSPEIIDSVIVHELAHLVYPNHSKNFYNFIYKYMPDYKQRSAVLDSAGI